MSTPIVSVDVPCPVKSRSKLARVLSILGYVYLVVTIELSVYYIQRIESSIMNDYYWGGFNTSGIQTFLADLFNRRFPLARPTAIHFNASDALDNSYALPSSFIQVNPTFSRSVLFRPLSLETAIESIRTNTFDSAISILIPHCWVDYNRSFQMAITGKRQLRCDRLYTSNVAVYFETLIRNAQWQQVLRATYFNYYNMSIFSPLRSLPLGRQWLDIYRDFMPRSVEAEVEYLRSLGMSSFTPFVSNGVNPSMENTITISNALGLHYNVKVYATQYRSRNSAEWTTANAQLGITNAAYVCVLLKCSLVRGVANSIDRLPFTWDEFVVIGPRLTPTINLVRSNIGPFGTIDIRLVLPPPQWVNYVFQFESFWLAKAQQSQSSLQVLSQWQTLAVDAMPKEWQGHVFFGGSPMCIFGSGKTFVQPNFAYLDSCSSQVAHLIHLQPSALTWACKMSGISQDNVAAICNMVATPAKALECLTSLHISKEYLVGLVNDFTMPEAELVSLLTLQNISLIQFATRNGRDVLLSQPMLPPDNHNPWSFYGWLTMYEWAMGLREVYEFTGDEGSYTTISPSENIENFPANPFELPQNACLYVWYIIVYITFVLTGIAAIIAFFLCTKLRINGSSLFVFNQVVGSVWIGRPALFVRGIAAIVGLSTSNLKFVVNDGYTRLLVEPRQWLEVFVLAGESTWVSYTIFDLFLPFTTHNTWSYSSTCCGLTWSILSIWEFVDPYRPIANVESTCAYIVLTKRVTCTSGTVPVGSVDRFWMICIVHASSIVMSWLLVWIYHKTRAKANDQSTVQFVHHVMIPAAADAYLADPNSSAQRFDKVVCVMAGMLPFRSVVFDLKIWGAISLQSEDSKSLVFRSANFMYHKIEYDQSKSIRTSRWIRRSAPLGLGYIIATVIGSYLYLGLTESTMTNDFWWSNFNSTGTQAYLCNWFNWNLQTFSEALSFNMDAVEYGDLTQRYNQTTATINSAPMYAHHVQNEVSSLVNVVRGLRKMDGCLLPWIHTSYCYVDFGRKWEMARSLERQERCSSEQTNGAIYLEPLLRNAQWSSLRVCWGEVLDSAVLQPLETTPDGAAWTKRLRAVFVTVDNEVKYWASNGILSFITQWQNFKRLGVIETIHVQNAFGLKYALTLKATNSTFQIPAQTMYKMNWGFANDLIAIKSNVSSIRGSSLVRGVGSYAFVNTTIEQVLVETGVLVTPVGPGMSLLREFLGPFGTQDIKRVNVPPALKTLSRELTQLVAAKLGVEKELLQNLTSIPATYAFTVQPKAWDNNQLLGGNIFCEYEAQTGNDVSDYFTLSGVCGTVTLAEVRLTLETMIKVVIASNLYNQPMYEQRIQRICQRENRNKPLCSSVLRTIASIARKLNLPSFEDAANAVKAVVRDDLSIHLIHFLRPPGGKVTLSRVLMFAATEEDFEFWTWGQLLNWVDGRREVIQIQGHKGSSLTTISGHMDLINQPPNQLELPLNVAYYIRYAIQYVTIVLLLVACIVVVYIFAMRGYIECWNMFEFNRVAGMVWVGRPLILLRGITAICLLSTSQLNLVRSDSGMVSYFTSPPRFWITTFMSCGETCWLVYIINDAFSPLTRQFTTSYSYKSSNLVWLVAFVWSMLAPPEHLVTIDRSCVLDSVDFQLVCQSGTMEIGSIARLWGLIGLAFACCLVCYLLERFCRPHLLLRSMEHSLLLHSAARNNLQFGRWKYQSVVYLDKASAVLNGIMSVQLSDSIHIFDIKSWRYFVIDVSMTRKNVHVQDKKYLGLAIPLLE